MPALDVLICTYERPAHVVDAVVDVCAQLGPEDRVLVLDQSAQVQSTAAAITALGDPRVRHLAAPALGLPAARNRALAETTAPLVVFFDDDVRLNPGCIEAHRRALTREGLGATVGQVEDRGMAWNCPTTRNEVGRFGRVRVNLAGDRSVEVQSVQGCNMGFKRSVLEEVGGFDVGYGGTALLEEADVAAAIRRAGWRIEFVPDASLVHLAAPAGGVRVGDPRRTEAWRFRNTGRYLAKHRGPAGVILAAPVFAAVSIKRAVEWGAPDAAADLMSQFWRGSFLGREGQG